MRVVVTGGAGFIGSNVVDDLLARGHRVVSLDNLTTGFARHLEAARQSDHFDAVECDLFTEPDRLADLFQGADVVVHLAANADVRFGWNAPRRDLEQNVIATHNVLEGVRRAEVPRLLFSSTGSVYGECPVVPTPEDAPFPVQTSLYGASKAAAEGYIAAYAEAGILGATVFRFVSVLGPRYSHGHVIDFVRQLVRDPTRLTILGDGTQRKSYMHVSDCVAAVLRRARLHRTVRGVEPRRRRLLHGHGLGGMDLRSDSGSNRSSTTPVGTEAGSATIRSSISIPERSRRGAGGHGSRSGRRWRAPSTTCSNTVGSSTPPRDRCRRTDPLP